MNKEIQNFLMSFYGQCHFDNMPIEQRATFDKYFKYQDYSGNMKEWEQYLDINPVTRKINKNKDLPDINILSEENIKVLYKIFEDAFTKINYTTNEDNKALLNFKNEYFGTNKLFDTLNFSQKFKDEIKKLGDFIEKDKHTFISQLDFLGYNIDRINSIIDIVKKEEYKKDISKKQEILNFIQNLNYVNIPINNIDLNFIQTEFNNSNIDPEKLNLFKKYSQSMLSALYKNKSLRNGFAKYDNNLNAVIDNVLSKVNYEDKNSDNYIIPKPDDRLTFKQQMSRWKADTYENYFQKFKKFTGDKLFFSRSAEFICKAIDASKIKKIEGLETIINKSGDIKKSLSVKSPTAVKHFDYFINILSYAKQQMPKAFADALHNGKQMRYIVKAICLKAVKDDKVEAMRTCLEVLSVVKYGNTTSKIMDAIKNEKVSLFSDGNLSWNKDKGISFVTKCMDKTIHTAIKGIGYSVVYLNNKTRRFKILDKDIKQQVNDLKDSNTKEITKLQTRLNDLDNSKASKELEIDFYEKIKAGDKNAISDLKQYRTKKIAEVQNLMRDKKVLEKKLNKDSRNRNELSEKRQLLDSNYIKQVISDANVKKTVLNKQEQYLQSINNQDPNSINLLKQKKQQNESEQKQAEQIVQDLQNKTNKTVQDRIELKKNENKVKKLQKIISKQEDYLKGGTLLQQDISNINNKQQTLDNKLDYFNRIKSQNPVTIKHIEDHIDVLEKSLLSHDNLNKLEKEIEDKKTQILKYKSDIQHINNLLNNRNYINDKLKEANDYLSSINESEKKTNDEINDLKRNDDLKQFESLISYWNILNNSHYNNSWSLKSKKIKQQRLYDAMSLKQKLKMRHVSNKEINKIII